jgi:hypothetical protein
MQLPDTLAKPQLPIFSLLVKAASQDISVLTYQGRLVSAHWLWYSLDSLCFGGRAISQPEHILTQALALSQNSEARFMVPSAPSGT